MRHKMKFGPDGRRGRGRNNMTGKKFARAFAQAAFEGAAKHKRRARMFRRGELKLILLHLIAEEPRHGYDLIKQIEELLEQSNGGFGAYLTLAHNWANNQATKKSYELFARHVMPHFQGQVSSTTGAADRARQSRPELADKQMIAVEQATERYEAAKGS